MSTYERTQGNHGLWNDAAQKPRADSRWNFIAVRPKERPQRALVTPGLEIHAERPKQQYY